MRTHPPESAPDRSGPCVARSRLLEEKLQAAYFKKDKTFLDKEIFFFFADFTVIMQDRGLFISPFLRPRCLAAAAPAGKAKLTHPGKAILAGKFIFVCKKKKVN